MGQGFFPWVGLVTGNDNIILDRLSYNLYVFVTYKHSYSLALDELISWSPLFFKESRATLALLIQNFRAIFICYNSYLLTLSTSLTPFNNGKIIGIRGLNMTYIFFMIFGEISWCLIFHIIHEIRSSKSLYFHEKSSFTIKCHGIPSKVLNYIDASLLGFPIWSHFHYIVCSESKFNSYWFFSLTKHKTPLLELVNFFFNQVSLKMRSHFFFFSILACPPSSILMSPKLGNCY